MDNIGRRTFVRGATAGALAFTVGGVEVLLLPSEARAQKVPLKVLSADEALRLEAVSETLVPGAREAGIAHFVDQQCSVPPHDALLGIRIGNVRPPFVNFYRAALNAIDGACQAQRARACSNQATMGSISTFQVLRMNATAALQIHFADGFAVP